MSEHLAEAQVLIRPDTRAFRADLKRQLAEIRVAPIAVPIVAAGAGLSGVAAATGALSAVQRVATKATLDLATAARVETTSWGRQAIILDAATAAKQRQVGAGHVLDDVLKKNRASLLGAGTAASKLDAALLGLRTAIGSSAVIGLSAVALGAIAVGKGIRASLIAFAEFQTALLTFRATTGATADEMIRVSQAALRLGKDVTLPAVSAGDAAVAMTELAKAGLTTEEAIAGARGVLQLATAAQIDNASAAELAASALNAFGLAGDQAVRVADDLANAANASQGSILDMGIALQQASAVARQVGFSLEDTVSVLTLLARNGLRGSDAGTSLRTALLRLVAPTKEASGLIRTLGLNIRDVNGNIQPTVFAEFAEATKALSPAMRDAIAAMVFGQDAIRAVAIAGREGASGLRIMQFQIDQQGTAAEIAAARTSGLAGAWSGLASNAQTLGINLGRLATGPLEDLIQGLSRIVVFANRAGDALEKLKSFDFPGGAKLFPKPVQKQAQDFIDIMRDVGKRFIGPQAGFFLTLNASIDAYNAVITTSTEKTEKFQQELILEQKALEQARIAAEKGGLPGLADQITKRIQAIREILKQSRIETGEILPPATDVQKAITPLENALAALRVAREAAFARGGDTSGFDRQIATVQNKIADLVFNTEAALRSINKITFEDLGKALQNVLKGFRLDPTGEKAADFLKEARRIVGQISKIGPDVTAAAKQAFGTQLTKPLQASIQAAIDAGDTGAAQRIRQLALRVMKQLGIDIKDAGDLFVIPATQDVLDAALAPSGLDVARAQAVGDDSALLVGLKERRAVLQRQIDSGKLTVEQETAAFNEIASINSQIEGVFQERNQAQETANQKIKDAREKAADSFAKGLAAATKPIERLQTRALGTEPAGDDIKFRVQLIAKLKRQIDEVRKTLGNTQRAREIISDIQDRILAEANNLRNDRKRFRQQALAAIKEQKDEIIAQRDKIIARVQLDVAFAQINENVKAEIAARQRLIKQYRAAQEAVKGNINEVKRYRNLIAEEQKAIEELKGQKDETSNAFNELAFDFLQKQQGFAANLLGNLIPGFATGGLVGGTTSAGGAAAGLPTTNLGIDPATGRPFRESGSPGAQPTPASGLQAQAAFKTASPTYGQAATEVDILKEMLSVLKAIMSGRAHPEAALQRAQVNSTMDFQGGV